MDGEFSVGFGPVQRQIAAHCAAAKWVDKLDQNSYVPPDFRGLAPGKQILLLQTKHMRVNALC